MQKLVSYCLNDTDKIKLTQTRDSIWELLQVTVPELVHRFTAFSDGQNHKPTIIRYLNEKKKRNSNVLSRCFVEGHVTPKIMNIHVNNETFPVEL